MKVSSDPPVAVVRRRPDAERNRSKILTAARECFADAQAEVSMAQVARRAGVGMATLYRNFPGRRDLVEALYSQEVDTICQAAQTAQGSTPGERCQTWLRSLYAFFAGKRQIASELLKHTDEDDPVFVSSRDRVIAAGSPLLAAAQQEGELRAGLTISQVLDLIHAIATIPGDRDYVDAILDTALGGLRPPADQPSP